MDEELRKAIFGNVGTVVAFPIGPEDAEFLETQFRPEFDRHDLIAQDKHHIYLKLAIDGKTSQPFSAYTLPPFGNFSHQENREKIVLSSRTDYSVTRNRAT